MSNQTDEMKKSVQYSTDEMKKNQEFFERMEELRPKLEKAKDFYCENWEYCLINSIKLIEALLDSIRDKKTDNLSEFTEFPPNM
tara:strand:- start:489 stop:740 length:252 start_codon:yes stop_codon:yes gene_type:complete